MKYSCDIVIDKPRDEVIKLFDDPENLKAWQQGLVSYEHLEGEFGAPGSRMRLLYKMGKREIEMIETVIANNPPSEFSGTYEAKGVHNIVHNRFEEIDANTTRWITETEFKFAGVGMRVMSWFMPGAFRRQTAEFQQNFKRFAEGK